MKSNDRQDLYFLFDSTINLEPKIKSGYPFVLKEYGICPHYFAE